MAFEFIGVGVGAGVDVRVSIGAGDGAGAGAGDGAGESARDSERDSESVNGRLCLISLIISSMRSWASFVCRIKSTVRHIY